MIKITSHFKILKKAHLMKFDFETKILPIADWMPKSKGSLNLMIQQAKNFHSVAIEVGIYENLMCTEKFCRN